MANSAIERQTSSTFVWQDQTISDVEYIRKLNNTRIAIGRLRSSELYNDPTGCFCELALCSSIWLMPLTSPCANNNQAKTSMNLIPKSGLWSAVTCPQTPRFTLHFSPSTKAKHPLHFQPLLLPLLFLCQTFTFSCLDRLHLGEANPLTASFIRMTSLNPFFDIGCVNPAHSLADWLYYEAQILRVLKNGVFCIREVATPSPLRPQSMHASVVLLRTLGWHFILRKGRRMMLVTA